MYLKLDDTCIYLYVNARVSLRVCCFYRRVGELTGKRSLSAVSSFLRVLSPDDEKVIAFSVVCINSFSFSPEQIQVFKLFIKGSERTGEEKSLPILVKTLIFEMQ